MTSNIGGDLIQAAAKMDDVKEAISALLKATFKPEFLNRIDETIFFNRLGKPEILKIVDIQLELLKNRLKEQQGHPGGNSEGARVPRGDRLRSAVRGAAAEADDPEPRAEPAGGRWSSPATSPTAAA